MIRIREDNPNTVEYWQSQCREHGFLDNLNARAGDLPYQIARWLHPGDRVLDVGAGSGWILAKVKAMRPQCHYSACDLTEEAVEHLRKVVKVNHARVVDLREPRWVYQFGVCPDVVLCTEVLEHMDDPAQLVEGLAIVGGQRPRTIIISTPFREQSGLSGEHVWQFDLDDVYDLLSPYGIVHLTVARGGSTIVGVCELT